MTVVRVLTTIDPNDTRFANVRRIVDGAIGSHVSPGAQLSVRWRDGEGWRAWDATFGRLMYRDDARSVAIDTPYDLASVTKALVALTSVRLASRGAIDLAAPLGSLLAEARGFDAEHVTLEQLAAHRAELPAWLPFFRAVTPSEAEAGGTRARIVRTVATTPIQPNGGGARYSDLGYILLGEAIARATGAPLGALVRNEVTLPLGLDPAIHYRGVTAPYREPHIAPTENCPWRGRVVQGNVHDENAYALEGVSGHAGLFGTANAMVTVGQASLESLRGDDMWFDPAWMRRMTAPRAGGSHRLGWDGKSPEGSSAGARMSDGTFGHLGFTGTSLWCDPARNLAVALITNRVHPSRDTVGIRELRIAVHDAVCEALSA